jgi:putative transposase
MSPPHKKKKYFKIVWIQNGIRVRAASNIEDDSKAVLILSLGKDGNKLRIPIEIPIPKYIYDLGTPSKVEIGWRKTSPGGGYEVRCIYTRELPEIKAQDAKVAAVDLGEVHPFVITNGENTTVYNGGELRAKRRYENMIKGRLDRMISRTASGSRRRRRLVLSKRKQTGKVNRQIRDIEHKLTRRAISDLEESGVTELVIGDLRRIRQAAPSSSKSTPENPTKGRVFDQKLHQAPLGRTKHYLSYKAKRSSIYIPGLQDEAYTSQTCPVCGEKNKPTNRCYRCKRCGLLAHRDAVGSWNIRAKYLGIHLWGDFPVNVSRVVGAVAAPTGVRYRPHMWTITLKFGVAVTKPI